MSNEIISNFLISNAKTGVKERIAQGRGEVFRVLAGYEKDFEEMFPEGTPTYEVVDDPRELH